MQSCENFPRPPCAAGKAGHFLGAETGCLGHRARRQVRCCRDCRHACGRRSDHRQTRHGQAGRHRAGRAESGEASDIDWKLPPQHGKPDPSTTRGSRARSSGRHLNVDPTAIEGDNIVTKKLTEKGSAHDDPRIAQGSPRDHRDIPAAESHFRAPIRKLCGRSIKIADRLALAVVVAMDLDFPGRAGSGLHRVPSPAAVRVVTPVVLADLTPPAAGIDVLASSRRRRQVDMRDDFAWPTVAAGKASDGSGISRLPHFARVSRSRRLRRRGRGDEPASEERQTCSPR